MKKALILGVLVGMALAFLPVCPIQFQIREETLKDGTSIFPVYERKFPFAEWKLVACNPLTMEEATGWIQRQQQWFPLVAYDSIIEELLPLDSIPIPRV